MELINVTTSAICNTLSSHYLFFWRKPGILHACNCRDL